MARENLVFLFLFPPSLFSFFEMESHYIAQKRNIKKKEKKGKKRKASHGGTHI